MPPDVKRGDVVRAGELLGVVLFVGEHPGPPPWLDLHVDLPDGVALWPVDGVVVANDESSRDEARRLGLRGLDPGLEALYAELRAAGMSRAEAAWEAECRTRSGPQLQPEFATSALIGQPRGHDGRLLNADPGIVSHPRTSSPVIRFVRRSRVWP